MQYDSRARVLRGYPEYVLPVDGMVTCLDLLVHSVEFELVLLCLRYFWNLFLRYSGLRIFLLLCVSSPYYICLMEP